MGHAGGGENSREKVLNVVGTSPVIGVVTDARYVTTSGETSQPELYYSYRQMNGRLPVQTVTLLARTTGEPAAAAGYLRAAVRAADDRLLPDVVLPLDQRVRTTLAQPRLYAVLFGTFAGLALIVAAVGLFGVLSYTVSQRSRELALRAALGARRVDIVRLVLRQGLVVTAAGVATGLLAAAWLTRGLSGQLHGVTPHDAVTFIAVPIALLAMSVIAGAVPARRAAGADPVTLLRGD